MPKFTRLLTAFLLLAISTPVSALTCRDYLSGRERANPDIVRFGGPSPQSPVARVANWMLDYVPRDSGSVQMAVPVALTINPPQAQQFGDGVQNANLTFGRFETPPFLALLVRDPNGGAGRLILRPSRDFFGTEIKKIEFRRDAPTHAETDEFGVAEVAPDIASLGWNTLHDAKPLYFRPAGWQDWFCVVFPKTHISAETLLDNTSPRLRTLPGGFSIYDPLRLRLVDDPMAALRNANNSLGFELGEAGPRVHGFYEAPDGSKIPTAVGTAVSRYRLPQNNGVKLIYLAQSPRDLLVEANEGLVSGTGPHFIGEPANAEIIMNTLGDDPILTFFGVPLPEEENLAWRNELTHLYIGTWQMPGTAFVAKRGTFHQHATLIPGKAAFAQVLTPPQLPTRANPYGLSE